MSTPKQKAANRANARHSTGPTSAEGKARSSRNHLSHGFASSATIMPGEDPEEFKASLITLALEFEPVTESEQILLEMMAVNRWLANRAFRLQNEAFLSETLNGQKFAIPKDLSLLIRYKTTADNAFIKARNELVKAIKQRQNQEIGFDPQSAPIDPAPEPEAPIVTPEGPTFPADDYHMSKVLEPSIPEIVKKAA